MSFKESVSKKLDQDIWIFVKVFIVFVIVLEIVMHV